MTQLCTWLFYCFLGVSILLTVREIGSGTPRGHGWIFGVVFTYITLLVPVFMHGKFGTVGMTQLYAEVPGIGKAIVYNCLQNAFLSSLGFFMLTMRDAKILSEEYVDKVGRMLWTFPSIPLTYAAFVRFLGWKVANVWFLLTSIVAGVLICGQKKGWWTSNLEQCTAG